VALSVADVESQAGGREGLTTDFLVTELVGDAQAAYDNREGELSATVMRELERRVVLSVLDRRWREHLYEMDYLREGIGLRAMAQRNPLVEYQREGYDMFSAMMDGIKEESVGLLFNVQVTVPETPGAAPAGGDVVIAQGLMAPKTPAQLEYSAPTVDGSGEVMHRTVAQDSADADQQGAQRDAAGADAQPDEAQPEEAQRERARGRRTRSKGRRR
jgi:preprotein translocase subunit SecA